MMLRVLPIYILLFVFSTFAPGLITAAYPQASDSLSTVEGIVRSEKGDPIANIFVEIKSASGETEGEYTSGSGKFSFEGMEAGAYTVTIENPDYVFYEIRDLNVSAGETKYLNVTLLDRSQYSTETIEVEEGFRQRQDDLRTSVLNISPKNVKVLPGAIEDVMRSLQSLPGVTSPNDFTSQLVIRGSGPDQNLIIMDDVEIFNPYRLYGLVSMFNPETLADITLITGGFPSKYGDRLSAVLDVINREGNTERNFSLTSNVNIANANMILEGKNPFKIPGSWIVSSRRTYYDLIVGPFAKNAGLITEDSSFPSFKDLQFKLAFGPFSKHKFLLNGIFSEDGVAIISGKDREDPDSVNVNDVTKNDVVSLAWHYIPNENFISRTTVSWYKNNGVNDFEGEILDPLIDKENLTEEQKDSLKAIGALLGLQFDSQYFFRKYGIGNRSVFIDRNDNRYEFGGGFDIITTDLTYNLNLDDQFRSLIQSLPNARALLDEFNIDGNNNYRGNVFVQGRFDINKKFFYQPSLRADYYSYLKRIYLSPRINLGYAIDPLTTIRAGAGVYYQSPGYEKLVDGRTFFDLNIVDGAKLKAEESLHYILGIERWLDNTWLAKVEGYFKKFNNLIVQEKLTNYRYEYSLNDPSNTDPSYVKDPANWTRSQMEFAYDSVTTVPVNIGRGDSYGIEFSLEKKYTGPDTKLYGWVNYALSFSNRVEDGIQYPYRFDQRHVFNIVLNYRVNSWFDIGARWSYATNFPFTPPVGITPRVVNDSIVVNPFTNSVVFNLDFGGTENKYSAQRPAYHRLDIRLSALTRFWDTDWTFYIDVMNVYNRTNVLGYDYSLNDDLSINRRVVGMIPILPTIGVNARF